MSDMVETLRQWVAACGPAEMVFLGGAGVSTESGLADFRSPGGLYNKDFAYPPEEILSDWFFEANNAQFNRFYMDNVLLPLREVGPNAAHLKLAQLEREGVLSAVITQNIDGLHQAAGSANVLELHGSVHRNYCMDCGAFLDMEGYLGVSLASPDGVARCSSCGGMVKPDVVLYGEMLDQDVMRKSIEAIRKAKLMVVAGTSLAVYPAAGLIDYFQGDHLVIINLQPTPRDKEADLCLQAKVGEVFSAL